METRNVKLTLEKAKEWYNKGGELKEIALQAYKEEKLIDWPESLANYRLSLEIADENGIPDKILYQWKLYKLLKIMNPKDFNPGYNKFYIPRIWWYKKKSSIYKNETFVGEVKTKAGETIYVSVGGGSGHGFVAGLFAGASNNEFSSAWSFSGAMNQLRCATPEIQQHLEKYFWKDILIAYYSDILDI